MAWQDGNGGAGHRGHGAEDAGLEFWLGSKAMRSRSFPMPEVEKYWRRAGSHCMCGRGRGKT